VEEESVSSDDFVPRYVLYVVLYQLVVDACQSYHRLSKKEKDDWEEQGVCVGSNIPCFFWPSRMPQRHASDAKSD